MRLTSIYSIFKFWVIIAISLYSILYRHCSNSRIRLPNLEGAAKMQHRQVVNHSLIITVLSRQRAHIPSHLQILLDNIFVSSHFGVTQQIRIFFQILQHQCSYSICTLLPLSVSFPRIFAIPVKASMRITIRFKKVYNPFCHNHQAVGTLTKQVIVHPKIHCSTFGIVHVPIRCFTKIRSIGSSVKTAVISKQTRCGVRTFVQMQASRLKRLIPPIRMITILRPASKQFYKCGQVISRFAKKAPTYSRLERDNE